MKLSYARFCVDCEEVFDYRESRTDVCPKCGSCSIFNLYNILNGNGEQTYLQIMLERRKYEQYHKAQ
jgi:Zn finger protein HypA/HybF involved in hydrogenase expression